MNYPENLRALSIAGAFPWIIATGEKQAEYRTWPIDSYRGLVLLHNSSSTWDDSWDEIIADGDVTRQQAKAMKGHIIGFAFLAGCSSAQPEGYDGYFHWMDGPALFAPENWQQAPGARNYWRPEKPAQQQAFRRAWQLIQDGQYQEANPDRTTELLVRYGYRKPRLFLVGPGGRITTNAWAWPGLG